MRREGPATGPRSCGWVLVALLLGGPVAAAESAMDRFVREMLGHIGASTESCPQSVGDEQPDRDAVCASYRSGFGRFKQEWEATLRRHDISDLARAVGPWTYTQGRYVRAFEVEEKALTVRFDEKNGRIALFFEGAPPAAGDEPRPADEAPRIAGFGGVTLPTVLPDFRVEPVYPSAAREARTEGSVTLEVVVLRDGSVDRVTVLRSAPRGWDFEESAIEAVRQWRFEPALDAGVPVDAVLPLHVDFKLPS